MRQDAIIEQVFGLVNVLLKKKKLQNSSDVVSRIRTYNVIPLSPLCGVIEWCDGAISFGQFLLTFSFVIFCSFSFYLISNNFKAIIWSALIVKAVLINVSIPTIGAVTNAEIL